VEHRYTLSAKNTYDMYKYNQIPLDKVSAILYIKATGGNEMQLIAQVSIAALGILGLAVLAALPILKASGIEPDNSEDY